MNEQVLTLKHKDGRIAKIFQDTNADSPRSWDNLGTIIVFDNKWRDFHDANAPGIARESWQEHAEEAEVSVAVGFDICDYGSSGTRISIATEDVEDADGVIFVRKDKLLKEFPQKTLTKDICPESIKNATQVLKGELETLQEWCDGEVYGFQILKPSTCKHCKHTEEDETDSCWGFYGLDHIKEELKSQGFKEEP